MVPILAIVGRPNVGKSTLFNRLVRSRRAIVQDDPGVTRDRHYALTSLDDRQVELIDTGGFVGETPSPIEALIRAQAQIAIDEADAILLMMDVRQGLTAGDRELAAMLRRTGKPVVYVANKVDGPKQDPLVAEFYELGADRVLPVSAEHALGMDDLLDAISTALPPPSDASAAPGTQDAIRVALVGRPNAGKSSLFNALVGEGRVIVSEEPGTTRDPVDTLLHAGDQHFLLVDTAGIRRRRTKNTAMERLAIIRGMRAITGADVVCLVVDAAVGPKEQDAKLASMADETGRGLVLVLTKSDLLPRGAAATRELLQQVEDRLGFVSHAPVLRLSSVTRKGIGKLLPTVRRVQSSCGKRIATAELNRFLEQAVAAHAPPAHRGKPVRFYYITQPAVRPPTFIASTSAPRGIPRSYRRYLINRLRERYRFEGAPIRLFLRGR